MIVKRVDFDVNAMSMNLNEAERKSEKIFLPRSLGQARCPLSSGHVRDAMIRYTNTVISVDAQQIKHPHVNVQIIKYPYVL